MAKRNRERAKQAKKKAKEDRKAQREADKLHGVPEEFDEFGNPIERSGDISEAAETDPANVSREDIPELQ